MAVLNLLINVLNRINGLVAFFCRYLIIVIVAALAVILIAAVVCRYGLNSALSWAEEGSKYLMVWLTFLGTPIVLRQFGHINIDLLVKALPARLKQLLYVFIYSVILFTMAVIFWHGAKFTEVGMRQVASSFNLSMLYMYIAVPIGAFLTCLVAFEYLLRAVRGVLKPESGLVDDVVEMDYAA